MRASAIALLVVITVGAVAAAVIISRGSEGSPGTTITENAAGGSATTTTVPPTSAPPTSTSEATTTTIAATTSTTSTTTPLPTPPPGVTACDAFGPIDQPGVIESPELTETSGIAASRTMPGLVWAHNDSRSGPTIHAIGPAGEDLGAFLVGGALAFDWEDMAAGPGPDPAASYLYIGDIGDNFGIRGGQVTIYRVAEPHDLPTDGVIPFADPLSLRYPDGNYNAEALFIDPRQGDLFLVTKDPDSARVYRAAAPFDASQLLDLELVAVLPLGAEATAADISWDGSTIALRGYESVWLWHRPPGGTIADALEAAPCSAPSPAEEQGESLAFAGDQTYTTISEGIRPPLHRVSRLPAG